MKALSGSLSALALLSAANVMALPKPANSRVTGEYVEARTCNVYTGACHANGESLTTGREAIMAWQVKEGMIGGVNVAGIKVLAVVAADANLAQETKEKRAVLYVDSKATTEQREAIASALQSQYAKQLGTVVSVKTASVQFERKGLEYTIRIPDTAYLKTTRYACDHCVMPHAIWYEPLVSLKSSIVAMSALNEYKGAPELSTTWRRSDENSSFVGQFSF